MQAAHLLEHAVDTVTDAQECKFGLEVDIGGAPLHRVDQQRTDQPHDRLLILVAARLQALVVDLTGLDLAQDAIDRQLVAVELVRTERGRWDESALALAAGTALKSFPVLLLPVLLLAVPSPRRVRYALLATAPVALLLLPFAIASPVPLARELFGYGGVADFGWIGAWRGVVWLATGALVRSEPRRWGEAVPLAKLAFVAVEAALVVALARGRLTWRPATAALAVFVAFQAFYGALSAQYLAWVVPLAALRPDRPFAVHAVTATLALLGFYVFLAPGVLLPADQPWIPREVAGALWAIATSATVAAAIAWLAALVVEGRRG